MLDRYLVDELLPSLTEGGYEVLQSKVDDDTTLAGMPAYQLVSTYTYNGIDYKTLETGIILGDKVYVIEYDAEESEYQKYLPIAQEMISSFKITK